MLKREWYRSAYRSRAEIARIAGISPQLFAHRLSKYLAARIDRHEAVRRAAEDPKEEKVKRCSRCLKPGHYRVRCKKRWRKKKRKRRART